MMIFTVLCVAISITLSQAYDCVCPTKEVIRVFPQPYLYNEAEIMIKTQECLAVRAYYKEWYNVIIDEKTGYVHESDIRMDPKCEAGLKTRTERFLFHQMKDIFETMACTSSCMVCKCGGVCFHTMCLPCKSIMCPAKPVHIEPSTLPRLHSAITNTNSPTISTSQGSNIAINSTSSPSNTTLHGLHTTINHTNSPSTTTSTNSASISMSQRFNMTAAPTNSPSISTSQGLRTTTSLTNSPSTATSQGMHTTIIPTNSPSTTTSQGLRTTTSPTNSPSTATSQGLHTTIRPTNSPSTSTSKGLRATVRPTNSPSTATSQGLGTTISSTLSPSTSTSQGLHTTSRPTNSPSTATSQGLHKIISLTNLQSTSTSRLHQIIVTETNPCISSPCVNGGLCLAKGHSYECFCKSHPVGAIAYTGKRCELQVNLDMISTVPPKWLVIHGK